MHIGYLWMFKTYYIIVNINISDSPLEQRGGMIRLYMIWVRRPSSLWCARTHAAPRAGSPQYCWCGGLDIVRKIRLIDNIKSKHTWTLFIHKINRLLLLQCLLSSIHTQHAARSARSLATSTAARTPPLWAQTGQVLNAYQWLLWSLHIISESKQLLKKKAASKRKA